MNPADWPRVSALLDAALDLEPAARSPWLAALRATAPVDADTVQRLLAREVESSGSLTNAQYQHSLQSLLTADDRAAASPGQFFGPWQVRHHIGSGGMGEVWFAERADSLFEGAAAIKLLRRSGDTQRLAARFARERQVLARLNHPHIARLLDAGIAEGQPYLVLEHVRGAPLPDYAAREAHSLVQRVQLVLTIARAVEYAHGRLTVHRDLKPGNVLVTPEGSVKLLDFGIADLLDDPHSAETSLTGLYGRGLTPDYAAPEQITGEGGGVGVDVFSLGVMLFELLTGHKPFSPDKPGRAALEHAVLHQPARKASQAARLPLPPNASRPADAARLPAALDAVLAKALAKSPEDRYPTMAAFAADLERWLEHRPVLAAQRDWRRDTALWLRRNRVAAGLGAAVIASLVVGLSAALWQARQAEAAARHAEQQAARAQAVSRFMVDLFRAADPEKTKGSALTALDVVDAGAQKLLADAGSDAGFAAEIGGAMGDTYVSLTRPDKALPVLQRAVAGAVAAYGEADVRTARLQAALALAEMQNEQYPESAQRYGAALPLLDAAGLGDDQDTLIARSNWAYALSKSGDFDAARAIFAESERRALTRYGSQSWPYADAVNNTATYHTIRSEWPKARDLFLSIEPLTYKPPPGRLQDSLTMRMNLANSLARTGLTQEALKRMPQLVADFTALIGAEGNQTLVARWFLGDNYKRMGQYPECAREYTDLAALRTRISGVSHPLTVDVVSKVAMCRRLTGELALSREYAARAAAALTPTDTPPQRTTLRIVSTLTNLLADQGDAAVLEPPLQRMRALMAALDLRGRDDRIYEAMLGAFQQLLKGSPQAALAQYETARREAPSSMQYLHPEAYYAYLLALAGQREAALTQLAKARALATTQFPAEFQLFAALHYVESLASGNAASQRAALQRLAAAYPVPVKLPLAPIWFGLG